MGRGEANTQRKLRKVGRRFNEAMAAGDVDMALQLEADMLQLTHRIENEAHSDFSTCSDSDELPPLPDTHKTSVPPLPRQPVQRANAVRPARVPRSASSAVPRESSVSATPARVPRGGKVSESSAAVKAREPRTPERMVHFTESTLERDERKCALERADEIMKRAAEQVQQRHKGDDREEESGEEKRLCQLERPSRASRRVEQEEGAGWVSRVEEQMEQSRPRFVASITARAAALRKGQEGLDTLEETSHQSARRKQVSVPANQPDTKSQQRDLQPEVSPSSHVHHSISTIQPTQPTEPDRNLESAHGSLSPPRDLTAIEGGSSVDGYKMQQIRRMGTLHTGVPREVCAKHTPNRSSLSCSCDIETMTALHVSQWDELKPTRSVDNPAQPDRISDANVDMNHSMNHNMNHIRQILDEIDTRLKGLEHLEAAGNSNGRESTTQPLCSSNCLVA